MPLHDQGNNVCVWSRKWVSEWKNSVQCPCSSCSTSPSPSLSLSISTIKIWWNKTWYIWEYKNDSSSDKVRIQVGCCCMSLLFCCTSLASHTTPPPRLCSLWNQSAFPVYSSWHQLTHSKGVIKNVISTVYTPLNFLDEPNTYELQLIPKKIFRYLRHTEYIWM